MSIFGILVKKKHHVVIVVWVPFTVTLLVWGKFCLKQLEYQSHHHPLENSLLFS